MSERSPTNKSVVDEAMLKAFAKGQLDEATEDKVVALLGEEARASSKSGCDLDQSCTRENASSQPDHRSQVSLKSI